MRLVGLVAVLAFALVACGDNSKDADMGDPVQFPTVNLQRDPPDMLKVRE